MAEQYAAKVVSDQFQKLLHGADNIPVAEMFERFLLSKPELQPRTVILYKRVQDAFCEVAGGNRSVDLNVKHIVAYRSSLQGKPVYRNIMLRHLHAVLQWASKNKLTNENLAESVDYFKEAKRIKVAWTVEQFRMVLSHCDPETRMMALLCMNGVGRVGSVAKLTHKNIDLEAGTVTLVDEKTDSERTTPLHPMVHKELESYLPGRTTLFHKPPRHEKWHKVCEAAGVPFMKFHDLRTCLSSWLQDAGVSSDIVADIFGHSSSALTRKHYTAARSTDVKRTAIGKLEL
jgi:integrase